MNGLKWKKGAKAVGHTLGDLDVRQNYEVTVIAIIKHTNEKNYSTLVPIRLFKQMIRWSFRAKKKHLKRLVRDFFSRGESDEWII
ncbi:hypothetical protein BsIDN1_18310 [Bacillus safensis]|uniref:Uncharacterized protein n=1 Tax=Bacillus safensis TaxID=561879 RepID=A0A5S9M502_BACIA|nr:hypothetical protein BsIDN1_18310 [Bacillus safensis]